MDTQIALYEARILADSISPAGHRLTTVLVNIPRIVLAELNTHRVLSRNSASSRAIPVEKRIKLIEEQPFIPLAFGKNKAGMQAAEQLNENDDRIARAEWLRASRSAVESARALAKIGVHKQLANRVVEPYSPHPVILTATEWLNFNRLRVHPHAQPEIRLCAEAMARAMADSTPRSLGYDEWHLPLVDPERDAELSMEHRVKCSAARCARVSYLTHEGVRSPEGDLELYGVKLRPAGHMSPLEHPARPMTADELDHYQRTELVLADGTKMSSRHSVEALIARGYHFPDLSGEAAEVAPGTPKDRIVVRHHYSHFCGNFNGWVQHRKTIPGEDVFEG